MDILLIATHCKRKPWYLTRADIFKNGLFRPLFQFLQMIPIYRIRDGRANLSKNLEIFMSCAKLLGEGEAILVFPEANHSLRRRVRPLSKGFTRVIDTALEYNRNLDLKLVPIGQNYQCPQQAGDSAALCFGKPMNVHQFKDKHDFAGKIKKAVLEELRQLTTHIEEVGYERILSKLEAIKADFTEPATMNTRIKNQQFEKIPTETKSGNAISRFLFLLNNLPIILLWRTWIKPKVPEPEFEATFRFGFSLLMYPTVYLLTFITLGYVYHFKTACLWVIGHAVCNLILVKIFGITSSSQRK